MSCLYNLLHIFNVWEQALSDFALKATLCNLISTTVLTLEMWVTEGQSGCVTPSGPCKAFGAELT